jgi:hypothetical protein
MLYVKYMCQNEDLRSFSVVYHIIDGLGGEKNCPYQDKSSWGIAAVQNEAPPLPFSNNMVIHGMEWVIILVVKSHIFCHSQQYVD